MFNESDSCYIEVYDSFSGDAKILKKEKKKYLIEIIDVCMCYSCQVQLEAGERMWISEEDIFSIKKI